MSDQDPDEVLIRIFARVDKIALGAAVGVLSGLILFSATMILAVRGGETVGPNLGLLVNYFPGYTVTPTGALVGLFHGFLLGSVLGFGFAALRNGLIFVYMATIRARAEHRSLDGFLDHF